MTFRLLIRMRNGIIWFILYSKAYQTQNCTSFQLSTWPNQVSGESNSVCSFAKERPSGVAKHE